jgi:hypothetical protein
MSAEDHMFREFTLLAVKNRTRRVYPWELLGYDILVDNDMNPWLLEINNAPSLVPHTILENGIKRNMVNDLLDLVDIGNTEREIMYDEIERYWSLLQQYES